MADISSRASMVQVWLSLPSQWTMDAVRFLNIFYQGGETYGISKDVGPASHRKLAHGRFIHARGRRVAEDAVNHHIDFLLCRLYRNRVREVQEVPLATHLIVSYSHTTMQ